MFKKNQNNFFFFFWTPSTIFWSHLSSMSVPPLLHYVIAPAVPQCLSEAGTVLTDPRKFLIWHFMQSSCLKASLATKHKSCKKVLFSAKFLEAFLIPHPFQQHTFIRPVTCQIQPLPGESLEGCSFGLCLFCTSVSYWKLLWAFVQLFQELLE